MPPLRRYDNSSCTFYLKCCGKLNITVNVEMTVHGHLKGCL